MNQETYQDLENGIQNLLPFERQMLLAKVYHYAWYSTEAFKELNIFLKKWEKQCEFKAVFFNNDSEESINQQ